MFLLDSCLCAKAYVLYADGANHMCLCRASCDATCVCLCACLRFLWVKSQDSTTAESEQVQSIPRLPQFGARVKRTCLISFVLWVLRMEHVQNKLDRAEVADIITSQKIAGSAGPSWKTFFCACSSLFVFSSFSPAIFTPPPPPHFYCAVQSGTVHKCAPQELVPRGSPGDYAPGEGVE